MTEYDIKRFGLILAKQAELEGMKARNRQKHIDAKNPDLPTYNDESFWRKAQEIEKIVYMHDHQL
jgi:hypothetical protein